MLNFTKIGLTKGFWLWYYMHMAQEINVDNIKVTLEGNILHLEMPEAYYEYFERRAEGQGLDFKGLILKIIKDQIDEGNRKAEEVSQENVNRVLKGLFMLAAGYLALYFLLGS